MEQKIPETPRTLKEYNRQKGPVPMTAIFLALGLFAVLILFFGLPALEIISKK